MLLRFFLDPLPWKYGAFDTRGGGVLPPDVSPGESIFKTFYLSGDMQRDVAGDVAGDVANGVGAVAFHKGRQYCSKGVGDCPSSDTISGRKSAVAHRKEKGGNEATLMVDAETIEVRCSSPPHFRNIFCPICPVDNELFLGRFLNSVCTFES